MKKKLLLSSVIVVFIIIAFLGAKFINTINQNVSEVSTEEVTESLETEEVTESLDIEKEISIDLGDGITIDLVYINSGEFDMGSMEEIGEEDETPVHKVKISKPFYMSKYEITQKQWEKVMKYNNSIFKGEDNPVDNISYIECKEFLDKLAGITGRKFSLPTEAQWEYACRAGTTTKWFFGNDEKDIVNYGWIDVNSNEKTHNVGLKQPNGWGLYDMYGNIQEWCSDWYENPYSAKDIENPIGPDKGESRVLRGGAWGDYAEYARSAYRNASGENERTDGIGMRCILNIT